jgi:predicted nuclease with TOPRIM domain
VSEQLKREFLDLLERDREFRYAVAGYLGLSELLERMDKAWAATVKLWREVRRMRREQEKLSEEVRATREDQRKLWESHEKLSGGVGRLERYVRSGFEGLQRALRYTFEDFASGFVKVMLEDMGYPGARVGRGYVLHEGRVLEVDVLCEDPLVVGEATLKVETPEEAEAEVAKLLERAEAAKRAYGREPLLKVLCVARAEPAAAETLRKLAAAHGIKLAMGEEIGWQ